MWRTLLQAWRPLLLLGVLLLPACAWWPDERPPAEDRAAAIPADLQAALEAAAAQADAGELAAAAARFHELAPQLPRGRRARAHIRAAELAWAAGEVAQTQRYLEPVKTPPRSRDLQARYHILQARLQLHAGEPVPTLPEPDVALDEGLLAEIYALRARVFASQGQRLEQLRARLNQARYLPGERAQSKAYEPFWQTLSALERAQLDAWQQALAPADPLWPWLALAELTWTTGPQQAALDAALARWRQRFPQLSLPATIRAQLAARWRSYNDYPSDIGVLLSLTGEYANVTRSLMTGLLDAYYRMPEARRPRLHVFDVGAAGANPKQAYAEAVAAGAEFVLGPFRKNFVTTMAESAALSVPLLALNYTAAATRARDRLYQFGLLPEDEVVQVAERLTLAGYRQALVMVPEGDWGTRLSQTFGRRFSELGGTVTTQVRLPRDHSGYGDLLREALQIREVERPQEQPAPAKLNPANAPADSDPARLEPAPAEQAEMAADASPEAGETETQVIHRDDVDVIFLGAPPAIARGIVPQLRFQYAGDLPVYATSHVFSGRLLPEQDQDLNGVVFCDMPWVLPGDNPRREALQEILADQPKQTFPRLLALGIDAFEVLPRLNYLAERPQMRLQANTGRLRMDDRQRLHRQLLWARFVRGKPRFLKDLINAPRENGS